MVSVVEREAAAVVGEEFLEPTGLVVAGQPGGQIDPVDLEVRRAAAKWSDRVAIGAVGQRPDQHAERDLERLRGVNSLDDPS